MSTEGTDSRALAEARADKLREATDVCEGLRRALGNAGITLPSLWVDTLSYAEERPRPLIELGGCNVETARRLMGALEARGGVSGAPPGPQDPPSPDGDPAWPDPPRPKEHGTFDR